MLAAPAWAQVDDEEAKAAAAELMDQGNAHYTAKRYDEAVSAYSQAYARYPSPKILLNLAQAESANGRADLAAAHYETFLASDRVDARDPQRESAAVRLEGLSRALGRMVFEDAQPGTEFSVDRGPLAPLPEDHLWLVPGRHQLRLERTGDQPLEIEIEVNAGQKLPVRARLAPIAPPPAIVQAPPPVVVAPIPPRAEDPSILGKWWFWAGAVAVVVGGVAIAVAVSSGGDEFVPGGELGRFETTNWDRIPGGG